jgi:beta-phosphoglucomutase-like phosphatase (HAD superfamily)
MARLLTAFTTMSSRGMRHWERWDILWACGALSDSGTGGRTPEPTRRSLRALSCKGPAASGRSRTDATTGSCRRSLCNRNQWGPGWSATSVQRAKPDPDLFLAAAERLNVPIARAMVVGDSVWDLLAARRAGCLGIGLLSGGYGKEELERVGAYRVYQDPADLLIHLDEVGVRIVEL